MVDYQRFISFFDYNIFVGKLDDVFKSGFENKRPLLLNTINPHSFVVATKDSFYKNALQTSDYLFADGIGIRLMAVLFFSKKIPLINGPTIHQFILSNFLHKPLKVVYLGSSENTLYLIKKKLEGLGAHWEVYTFSPPFKENFSEDDNFSMVNFINKIQPDIVFVGMTAPKQEKWVKNNAPNVNASYILSIGAVFDFFAETKNMGPEIIQKLNLVWAYRLVTDFKRVWKRTFISLPVFVFYNIFPKLYYMNAKNINNKRP